MLQLRKSNLKQDSAFQNHWLQMDARLVVRSRHNVLFEACRLKHYIPCSTAAYTEILTNIVFTNVSNVKLLPAESLCDYTTNEQFKRLFNNQITV